MSCICSHCRPCPCPPDMNQGSGRCHCCDAGVHDGSCARSWWLEGYDAFSGDSYPLGPPLYEHGYDSRSEALRDAQWRLSDLERSQPTASSGGQAGIQDRVYVVHPDGHRERVLPGRVPSE